MLCNIYIESLTYGKRDEFFSRCTPCEFDSIIVPGRGGGITPEMNVLSYGVRHTQWKYVAQAVSFENASFCEWHLRKMIHSRNTMSSDDFLDLGVHSVLCVLMQRHIEDGSRQGC